MIAHVSTDNSRFGHVTKHPTLTGVSLMSTVLRLRSTIVDDSDEDRHARGKTQQLQQPPTGIDRRHARDDERRPHHKVMLRWNELLNIARRDDPDLMANDDTIESEFNLLQTAVSLSIILMFLREAGLKDKWCHVR